MICWFDIIGDIIEFIVLLLYKPDNVNTNKWLLTNGAGGLFCMLCVYGLSEPGLSVEVQLLLLVLAGCAGWIFMNLLIKCVYDD